MKPEENDKASRDFLKLVEWPGALGLGALTAFFFSLKQVNPEVRLEVDAWSAIALVVGTVGGWYLIHGVIGLVSGVEASGVGDEPRSDAARAKGRFLAKRMWVFGAVLGLITIGAFLYSTKDISAAKRWDMAIGAGGAVAMISVAMFLFWRLVQFLEAKGLPEEEEDKEDH